MDWIVTNWGTIIVGAFVLGLLSFLVVYIIKQKKQGKSSCSCGCSSCPNAQICHVKNKQEEEK